MARLQEIMSVRRKARLHPECRGARKVGDIPSQVSAVYLGGMDRRQICMGLLALGLVPPLAGGQEHERRLADEFSLRFFRTNGITVRAAVEGSGPLIILVHGFPELWYSWRHQIPALAEAGYRVVAPDVRGYGGSDKPRPIEAYDMAELTADVVGLIDALGEESAILVGHDWGAQICWNTAFLHPTRVSAVAGLSIPPVRRGAISAIELFRRSFQGQFFYQLYFQEEGIAEAELEADIRTTLRKIYFNGSGDRKPEDFEAIVAKGPDDGLLDGMRDPEDLPDWLTSEDLDYYELALSESGFRGALNRYRAQQRDWEILPQLSDLVIRQPSCFIAGTLDGVRNFWAGLGVDAYEDPGAFCTDFRGATLIEGEGHFVHEEAPEAVNSALLAFLSELQL
jgi:pimeloyl-ACP methyl ester carboxylesterase